MNVYYNYVDVHVFNICLIYEWVNVEDCVIVIILCVWVDGRVSVSVFCACVFNSRV